LVFLAAPLPLPFGLQMINILRSGSGESGRLTKIPTPVWSLSRVRRQALDASRYSWRQKNAVISTLIESETSSDCR
jgi:hypothetical protein